MEQKIEKNFFVFQILAFELGGANSRHIENYTCHEHSICQKTPLTFNLTLGETFSKRTSSRMIKKHDTRALIEFSQVFGTFSHADCQSVF